MSNIYNIPGRRVASRYTAMSLQVEGTADRSDLLLSAVANDRKRPKRASQTQANEAEMQAMIGLSCLRLR